MISLGLGDDNDYNEFQSDSNTTNDNTTNAENTNLKTIISNYQNSNDTEIAPNVNRSKKSCHGSLMNALERT
jgi:hypothetical protein